MPLITDLCRPDVLGHEVEWKNLVPRHGEGLADCECLVAIFDKSDLAGAIVDEVGRDRRVSDLVVIDVNQGSWRIAADGHPSLHTAARSNCEPQTAGHQSDLQHNRAVFHQQFLRHD